jgi:hypothetical protein
MKFKTEVICVKCDNRQLEMFDLEPLEQSQLKEARELIKEATEIHAYPLFQDWAKRAKRFLEGK